MFLQSLAFFKIEISLCERFFLCMQECMGLWDRYTRRLCYQSTSGAVVQVFEAEIKIASTRTTHELDIFEALSYRQHDHVCMMGIRPDCEENGWF